MDVVTLLYTYVDLFSAEPLRFASLSSPRAKPLDLLSRFVFLAIVFRRDTWVVTDVRWYTLIFYLLIYLYLSCFILLNDRHLSSIFHVCSDEFIFRSSVRQLTFANVIIDHCAKIISPRSHISFLCYSTCTHTYLCYLCLFFFFFL